MTSPVTAANNKTNSRDFHSALALAALALAATLWGTGFFFGKVALEEMTVAENVSFRFLIGSLILLPILITRAARFAAKDFWLLLFGSIVTIPVQFLVQFRGLQLTTVSHAALMVGTLPMMLALSSVLFLGEHLRPAEWCALLVAAAGAALIALSRNSGHAAGPQASATGDLLVLVSMLTAVATVLITKHLVHLYDPLYVTAAMIIMGTVVLLAWVELTHPIRMHFSLHSWMAVGAQGVLASSLSFLFWNWGIARVPASRAGVFMNIEPLIGTLLGVLILGERLGILAILGGLLILGAAAFFTRTHHQQTSAGEPIQSSFGEGAAE